MSVANGQKANATVFNNAFVSKSADNVITGENELQNALNLNDGVTAQIPNAQTAINSKADTGDTRFPTTQEKAALVGTQGAPSGSNAYVTNEDDRLSSARDDLTILDNQSSFVNIGYTFDEAVSEVQELTIAVRRRDDGQEQVDLFNVRAAYFKDAGTWQSLGFDQNSANDSGVGVEWQIASNGDLPLNTNTAIISTVGVG